MTPLGEHLRELRKERGITQKQMADGIGISAAYLSALEHGHRGLPSFDMMQRIIGYLHIIWDDAENLEKIASLSDPRVIIDTTHQSAIATERANMLAQNIHRLSENEMREMVENLRRIT